MCIVVCTHRKYKSIPFESRLTFVLPCDKGTRSRSRHDDPSAVQQAKRMHPGMEASCEAQENQPQRKHVAPVVAAGNEGLGREAEESGEHRSMGSRNKQQQSNNEREA